MPGDGTEKGEEGRRELDRAGRAMEEAERALREGDLAGALDSQAEGWVTTWPVLTEATHLLTRWIGTDAAQALLREVADGAIAVWTWPLAQTERMVQLMARYASLPMDLADASLVLLAEELGHGRILTTDARDFGAYRFKSRHPFQNLLETSW